MSDLCTYSELINLYVIRDLNTDWKLVIEKANNKLLSFKNSDKFHEALKNYCEYKGEINIKKFYETLTYDQLHILGY